MLARRSRLALGTRLFAETPLLVPAFSSRGCPEVARVLEFASEFITEALLVSAYDVGNRHLDASLDLSFARLVLLDSGGYETTERSDLSDIRGSAKASEAWDEAAYAGVLADWPTGIDQPGLIAISYDAPGVPIGDQARMAQALLSGRRGILRELLLKPESRSHAYVHIDAVLERLDALADFDVIGATEKELGSSVFARMENIARLRCGLDAAGIPAPIHVLGALDPLSAPLYCLAGAEIFDSLSWLRLAYRDGLALYKQNYGILELGVHTHDGEVDARCWAANLGTLYDLELEMRAFCESGSFSSFSRHANTFEDAYRELERKLRRKA
jgi:hypothetical protein